MQDFDISEQLWCAQRVGHIYKEDAHIEVAIFTWKKPTVLKRMKNKLSDFYYLSYGWLYLQFTGDTPSFLSVSPTKKNFFPKWPNLHESCAMCWNEWKVNFSIFNFWGMIDIWLILYWNSDFFHVKGALPPKPLVFVGGLCSNVGGSAPGPQARCFWLNSSSQLVLGYHWLGLLNNVTKNLC